MRKFVLLFSLLVLVLSACRIESNMKFDINEDGSAVVGIEIGFDDEFLQLIAGQAGGSVDDVLDEMLSGLGGVGGDEVETRKDGDMNFYGTSMDVADLSTWDWESFGEGGAFSDFSYESGDTDKFMATLGSGLGEGQLGDLGDFGIDPSALTGDIISANLMVKMPGDVKTSNADEVQSDGTLVWNIPLTGTVTAQAESSDGSSASMWLWIILGILLVVAIVSGILAVVLTKKGSEKAVEDAAAAHKAEAAAAAVTTAPADETSTLEIETTKLDETAPEPPETVKDEEE
jgi:hypothetical protein